MLTLTPQTQKALGDAVLVMQDDVMYITNAKGWMLVIPSPASWLPAQVVELVRNANTQNKSRFINWRILNAKTVDYTNDTFLPHRARKHRSLWLGSAYDFPSLRESNLYKSAESMSPSLFGDLIDLEQLFTESDARVAYSADLKKLKASKRAFAKEENAESYTFRFDDKILRVHGPQLRSFREMGFVAFSPRERYGEHAIPPIGLRWQHDSSVFGFFMPMADAGVFEDRKGRDLFFDAGKACWDSEEEAIQALCDPSSYSFKGGKHRHLGDILAESWGHQAIRRAVTALMWKGWSVEDIDAQYENARYAAYCTSHESMQQRLLELREELSTPELQTWRIRNIESEVKRHCDAYEAMGHLASFDLGHVPEVIRLVSEAMSTAEYNAIGA
jgi:hypothetical protein